MSTAEMRPARFSSARRTWGYRNSISARATERGDVQVSVIDSGPGLSEEDAAKLFERGYRGTHAGHSQGGGIGLSIVRRLCELYGWDVRVLPGSDKGVVAILTFGKVAPTLI